MTELLKSNLLLLSLIMLLAACTAEHESPFSLDPAKGSFSLGGEVYSPGPFRVEINEMGALEEAHIFKGRDSLVAIGSRGGLDVLLVFKENEKVPTLQISVINPGDSVLKFSSMEVFSEAKKDGPQSQSEVFLGAEEDPLWLWLIEEEGAGLRASLDLSGSSLILLPGERVLLPPLHFFSHLCSE